MTRKQRKETDETNTKVAMSEACRYGIFIVDPRLAVALAALGVDTLKYVGGIRGIMGKWSSKP